MSLSLGPMGYTEEQGPSDVGPDRYKGGQDIPAEDYMQSLIALNGIASLMVFGFGAGAETAAC